MAEHHSDLGPWPGRAGNRGQGTAAMAPAPCRPSPQPAAADDASWLTAVSASAGRVPSFLHLLADVALTATVLGHRAVQVVDVGPLLGGSRVALTSAAALISHEAGVALNVRSATDVELRHGGAAPLGCVAIDLRDVDGVSRGLELLAMPADVLLPRVLVPVGPLRTERVPTPPDPPPIAAFNAGRTDRQLLADRTLPWGIDNHDAAVLEQLFVLDVPAHPHGNVIPLGRREPVMGRRRTSRLSRR